MDSYKTSQRERPVQKWCRWDPKARDGEGAWVAVSVVKVPPKVKPSKEQRAAMRMHMPTSSKRRTKVLASKSKKLRESDGEPTLASVKRARQERLDTMRPRVTHLAATADERRKARNKRKAAARKQR